MSFKGLIILISPLMFLNIDVPAENVYYNNK